MAFDTGTHSEITRDALEAESFGNNAIGVAQVNNWFCDFYEQASSNPFSGHGGWFKRVLSMAITTEEWPSEVIKAAWRCHFDNVGWLSNTQAETGEWNRLRRAVWTLVQEARDNDDPEELLAVLGISLHQVQDFYAHTNWVEPRAGHGVPGADGPGWQERGYGSSPTWFDVPATVREENTIYSDESQGHRLHGFWDTDRNVSIAHGMNKDWPGRPYYIQAATTAYFATRQWIEAVRSWVNEPAFWAEAQRYHADQDQLSHDLEGMHDISLYAGHWEGQGEPTGGEDPGPGGSVLDLRGAIRSYFEAIPGLSNLRSRTEYRARFQSLIKRVEEPAPSGELAPVPSSQPLQKSMRFVVLRVLSMKGEGLGDPGPDPADLYANVGINGQTMSSAVIENEDSYSFPKPNAPFTWIKAVPAVPDESEPVESIEVEVHTADDAWAGTDDDVFLRLGRQRFELDKGLTNDFERGDRDTYSVPIDDAVREGMTVNEINRVEIEKSSDGIAGGWKLGGITVRVNGRVIADDPNIDKWLEDNHRTWWAPDFTHHYASGPKVPVWVNLREDDTLYGGDDEGDINPFDNRDLMVAGYAPGEPPLKVSTHGGNKLGGRIGYGGDGAAINYRIETITPEIMGSPASPPTASLGPLPDLTIASFESNHITIANLGEGPAGPFRLKVALGTIQFPGLAPGATLTKPLVLDCGSTYYATVDDLEQVDETDESNNSTIIEPGFC